MGEGLCPEVACKAYAVGKSKEIQLEASSLWGQGTKDSGLLRVYFLLESRKSATSGRSAGMLS